MMDDREIGEVLGRLGYLLEAHGDAETVEAFNGLVRHLESVRYVGGGAVVIDEMIAPVVRIEMKAKAFIVTARMQGPVRARYQGWCECKLHASDGTLVMGSKVWTGWPEVLAGDTVEFSFSAQPKESGLDG